MLLLAMLLSTSTLARQMQTHTYKVAAGHAIRLDVHWADSESLLPTIFFIHGGALIMGNRGWTGPAAAYFLDRGYNFVSIDYRLAPQVQLPEIVEDVESAWDWIQTNGESYGVDRNRVAVMGQSAGGYLALSGGHRFAPVPKAVVSLYGYGDLTGPWYAQPSEHYQSNFDPVSQASAWGAVGDTVVSVDEGTRFPFYLYSRQQ